MLDTLLAAKRPLIVAGGGAVLSGAWDEITRIAETLAIPVARAAAAAHNRPAFIQLTRQSPIALADRGLIDHP